MPSLDTYRNNANRKRTEIAKLQKDKANETKKSATITNKINSASKAIKQTKNTSTINSKLREIERLRNGQSKAEKKIADLDLKVANKNKELTKELERISKEEEKQLKKRIQETKKVEQENSHNFNNIKNTLNTHSVLHKETRKAIDEIKFLPEKITVLYLASNPIDQQQLRLDEEARLIMEMIRKSEHRDSVNFETRWAIRPMDILQAINELNPTVIHFSGHGSDRDEIIFQDDNGLTKLVSKEAIVQTMIASSSDIRLVFFNTCFSHSQAKSVTEYVDSAIGMKTSIGDDAARIFAAQFYSAVSFGKSLKIAFEQAKALLMLENIPEENTPELYTTEGLDPEKIIIVKPKKGDYL